MQFERFYSLSDIVVRSFYIYIIYDFSKLSQFWGNVCGGNSMNVLSYAHPQLFNSYGFTTFSVDFVPCITTAKIDDLLQSMTRA